MNNTKMELYNPVTWDIFEQVYKLYGSSVNELYIAEEYTGDIIELVKEQLKHDLRR